MPEKKSKKPSKAGKKPKPKKRAPVKKARKSARRVKPARRASGARKAAKHILPKAPPRRAVPRPVKAPRRRPPVKFSPAALAEFRRSLEAKREEIRRAYMENQRSAIEQGGPHDTHDTGDVASSAYTRDFLLTLGENEQMLIRQIDNALMRLGQGQFGVCEICGDGIPEARLRYLPWATLCTPCQSLQEK
jgi:DnaK suppressor protein